MDAGELVPDEIVVGVVEECLAPGGPLGDGFVLDGFPRTLQQAQELDRVLGGHPLDLAINLDVPREIVLDRLAGRRVCENCQRVYHVNLPPTSTGPATRAAATSCSATTTPRRRSTAGSSSTSARRCRSSTTTATSGCSRWSTASARATIVFDRILMTVDDRMRSKTRGPAQDRRPDRADAPGGSRRRRDARGVHPRREAGATTADLDAAAREVLDRRDARSNFLSYHGFPAVACISPNEVIVHGIPGDRACSTTATSSRSTAARSSRAGTPTPRSRSRSVPIDDESQRLIDMTRASLDAAIGEVAGRQPARRHRRRGARRWSPPPGSRSCGSTSATASAPRCTRSPTSRTTDRRAGA